MLEILVLVLAILAFVALLFVVIMFPVARRARRMKAEMEAEVGDAERKENAQGLGLGSRGKSQVRGNGWLVLTADELRFRQWVPDRETRIPRAAITAVDTPRSWLGKSVGRKLLVVRWQTPDGRDEAMAWNVRDLDAWLAALH